MERKYAFYFTKLEGWPFRVAWTWKRNKWSGNLIKPDPSGRSTFWAASVALDLEENSVVEKTMMQSSTSPSVPRCEPHIFLPCCELCGCAHPCRKGTSSESLERLNQTCPIWPRAVSHTCMLILSWAQMTFTSNITLQRSISTHLSQYRDYDWAWCPVLTCGSKYPLTFNLSSHI